MANGGMNDGVAVFTAHIHHREGDAQPKDDVGAAYLALMPTGFVQVNNAGDLYDATFELTSITKTD